MEQIKEQKEQNQELTQMIRNLTTHQQKTAEETTQRFNSIEEKQDSFEKRLEKIEQGGTDKGEHSFRGQHMLQIERAKYGIKVLGMGGKVSELNAKNYLETHLNLTKTTLDNMGIAQAFRTQKRKGTHVHQ